LVTGSSCATAGRDRTVTTVAGAIEVTGPRVHDNRGRLGRAAAPEVPQFDPAAVRASAAAQVSAVLPLCICTGLSTGDFVPALSFLRRRSRAIWTRRRPPDENLADEQEAFASRSAGRGRLRVHLGRRRHFNVRPGRGTGCAVWSWSECGPTGERALCAHAYASRQSPGELLRRTCMIGWNAGAGVPAVGDGARRRFRARMRGTVSFLRRPEQRC